jgi:diaminohydroxyphosphoribosylaminopyrimidine deaminase/5-amino-6-(5-phosphoribosylamino)uracil reductase
VLFLKSMDQAVFMKKTLQLAARARGMTSPNPLVGALLVKKGRIISEGYHRKAGTPHAEAIAIDLAGERASGATLYVNLEPCCHKDKRTPPCTQKIISSGIEKVIVAMEDPNPKVSGKGIAELRKAGITVVSGVMEEKARELNEYYIKHITTGTPFVIMKVAMTLDGKIATPEGESKWITGEEARAMVHRLRGGVDALMSAIGTVKADNPRLTCRSGKDRSPARIVIDPGLEVSMDACVVSVPPPTILVTRKAPESDTAHVREREEKKKSLLKKGLRIVEYQGEKVDLGWLMNELGGMGIISLLIEGGSSLNSYCLESGNAPPPQTTRRKATAPAVGGMSFRKLADAYRIKDTKIKRFGDDILIEGYVNH